MPDGPFDHATAHDDGRIEFDFGSFANALFGVTADPDADLAAWLLARTAAWPSELRTAVAPRLLQALGDEATAVSPRHFAVLVAAYRLADPLVGVPAHAIEGLRAANLRKWNARLGIARGRRLLARDNLGELVDAMRPAGYPPVVTRTIARVLTSRRAAAWAVLIRWVPWTARLVMKLLRHISANAAEALVPPLDPRVLARWQGAERAFFQARNVVLVVGAALLFLAVLGYAIQKLDFQKLDFDERADSDAIALDQVNAIWREETTQPQKAVDDYTAFISAHPSPRTQFVAQDVANAMFNRGIVLGKMDRPREAERSYRALDDAFGDSGDPMVRLRVAQGLNNWAYLLGQRQAYQEEASVTRKLVARYRPAGDEENGLDSFDVQIARALINQANALEHLGDKVATFAACQDLLTRFRNARTDEMQKLLATARDIEHDYMPTPVRPAPFSIDGPPKLPNLMEVAPPKAR